MRRKVDMDKLPPMNEKHRRFHDAMRNKIDEIYTQQNAEYVTLDALYLPADESSPFYRIEIEPVSSSEQAFLNLMSIFFWYHRGYALKRDGWHRTFTSDDMGRTYSVYQFSRTPSAWLMTQDEPPF